MEKVKENSRHLPSEHGLLGKKFRIKQLTKLGLKLDKWDYVIALAGNPNTGKSTVFNSLTGLRQHTGNWPGKTVNRAEGGYSFNNKNYKLVDLPGTYSLLSTSEDEEIARNFILFGQPDVTVIVADATRLERNLNLTLQILEITPNAVLCLNLMDEARRKGIQINTRKLEQKLGIPVIATTARYGDGIQEILEAIEQIVIGDWKPSNKVDVTIPQELESSLRSIEKDLIDLYPTLPNTRWIALRLLESDEHVIEALKNDEFESLVQSYSQTPLDLQKELEEINRLGEE
jgi:ferrous iron transport protein B